MKKRPDPEKIADENPEWTEADLARAQPFSSLPASLRTKLRGRPTLDEPKVAISLRLAPKVLNAWKATGGGWQTRMAATLAAKAPHTKAR